MGKDIKQGDDDGMKDEDEGVHLAPAFENGRRRLVILGVKVGVGRWHFCCVFVYKCIREFAERQRKRLSYTFSKMHIYTYTPCSPRLK